MSGIPTNRTAVSLPAELSQEILQKAVDSSAIMRLATKVNLPGRGLSIPQILGDPEAAWVDETDNKPVKNPSVGMKVMKGYTLAVILPFSNQFRRDLQALYNGILARLPGALGKKFDQTVIGAAVKPGDNFDNLAACTAQTLIASGSVTTYDGLVAAQTDIAEHGGIMNGIALAPQGNGILLGAKDTTGRPIFVNSVAEGAIPQVLGVPTYAGRGLYKAGVAGEGSGTGAGTPAIVGVAGDWTQAMYGLVNDIEISFADQASLTYTDASDQTVTINLFQKNMFAVRCEFEAGFIAQTDCFNLLTGAIPAE